jgi:transcription initiation factor TFIIIB Brf1 subunit/transcription initiation factor TFIIB
MYQEVTCDGCKGKDLRELHGDLTCVNCGLVKYTHMIDDTYTEYSHHDNNDYCIDFFSTIPSVKPTVKKVLASVHKDEFQSYDFRKILDRFSIDDTVKQLALEWFKDTSNLKITPKKIPYIHGVCIYCASIYIQRGISIHSIARHLQISHTKIYTFLPRVLETWSSKSWYQSLSNSLSTHTDKLTRMLHNLLCIPSEKAFQVLKPSQKLYDKIHNCPKLNAVKSHTLIACCIFIGASMAGVKLQKSQFCKEVGISMPTLKSHEKTIQNVLIEMKSHK